MLNAISKVYKEQIRLRLKAEVAKISKSYYGCLTGRSTNQETETDSRVDIDTAYIWEIRQVIN